MRIAVMRRLVGICIAGVLALAAASARSDETRFEQYQYDAAGNIVGITTVVVDEAPQVTSINPPQVREGTTVAMRAVGNNLLGVEVTAAAPGLGVQTGVATLIQVDFDLSVTAGTAAGAYDLSFTTALGSATATVNVIAGVPPKLYVTPDPVALADQGGPANLTLRLSAPDSFGHDFTLTLDDPGVASVSGGPITIPEGQTDGTSSATISPNALGSTTLRISAPLFGERRVPVYVTEPFSGEAYPVSQPLGVVLTIDEPLAGSVSPVSQPLGVVLTVDEPLAGSVPPVSQPLGVTVGPYVESVAPTTLPVGAVTLITLTGANLDLVESIRVEPVTVEITTDVPTAAPDGTELTVTIDVGAAAAAGSYVLFADGAFGSVPLEPFIEVVP